MDVFVMSAIITLMIHVQIATMTCWLKQKGRKTIVGTANDCNLNEIKHFFFRCNSRRAANLHSRQITISVE